MDILRTFVPWECSSALIYLLKIPQSPHNTRVTVAAWLQIQPHDVHCN
jgi:hypothetical protein